MTVDLNRIRDGADFNFFTEKSISATEFQQEADYFPAVRGSSFSFYVRNTGGTTLEYSFNGITLHGRITAAQDERFFPNRSVGKMWFRAPGGATTVEVEGWANA